MCCIGNDDDFFYTDHVETGTTDLSCVLLVNASCVHKGLDVVFIQSSMKD